MFTSNGMNWYDIGQKVLWARAEIARLPALSDTDAEPYIAVELGDKRQRAGSQTQKGPLDLVIGLQHKRSAMRRDAAMCWRLAVVGLLAIVEGRRDPE